MLTSALDRRNELMLVSSDDKRHSREIVSEEHHYKNKSHGTIVSNNVQHEDKGRHSNASAVITGVECTPLLLGRFNLVQHTIINVNYYWKNLD